MTTRHESAGQRPRLIWSGGDSYSSGTGVAKGKAWPTQLERLGVPGWPAQVIERAVALARVPHVGYLSDGRLTGAVQRGQWTLQLGALDLPDADAAMLTIGGNDAGFRRLLVRTSRLAPSWRDPYGVITREIDAVESLLVAVCSALRQSFPNAWCAVLLYPHIMSEEHPLRLWSREGRRQVRYAVDHFAVLMTRAAAAAGVHVLDPREHFAGHEAGTEEPWIHGLHASRSPGIIGGSLHPTVRGHEELARFVQGRLIEGLAAAGPKTRAGLTVNPPPQP